MKYKKLIKLLKKLGFYLDRVKGSHYIYLHPKYINKSFVVIVHSKEVSRNYLKTKFKEFDINYQF